jgi:predicted extracellular nuclease
MGFRTFRSWMFGCGVLWLGLISGAYAQSVFINEIHYDNASTDVAEAIEIAGPAGTDLSGWSIVLYNGNTPDAATVYDTDVLTGTIPDQAGGYGTKVLSYPSNGIQNGGNDAIALVDGGGSVVQFLSYEGVATASDGPAAGMSSTDIGVAETSSTPEGQSLQLSGSGNDYTDFIWQAPATASFASINPGQSFVGGADLAPTVAGIVPAADASGVSTDSDIVVDFSEAVSTNASAFALSCGGSPQVFAFSGSGARYTLDPAAVLPESASCTVTIQASGVTDLDGVPETMAANFESGFTTAMAFACGAPATPISAIQGSGSVAAITGAVTVEAVVVADFQGSASLSGFYLQEEPEDQDGDSATSEGIFVYSNTAVSVGDVVRVAGTSGEYSGQTQISSLSHLAICSSGYSGVVPTSLSLPFDAADTPERYEGMLVGFPQTLSVTDSYTLGRYGEVVLSSGGRLVQPTQDHEPGDAANAAQQNNDLNQILLDDANSTQNRDPIVYPAPGLTALNTLRGGDTVSGLTGVMGEAFGAYRVQPTVAPQFVPGNPRAAAPDLPGQGSLRVASFNVLNYFNGDGAGGGFPTSRGAETPLEFQRQRDKIIAAISAMQVDIVGLIEIENDGYAATGAIADLVAGLNEAAPGGTSYAFVNPGVAAIGTDEIAVGFVYRAETVAPDGAAAILDSSVDPLFNDQRNRPALAQTFRELASGARFTAVINHFKSKGSACDDDGDPDLGDGQGNCNVTRTHAATALADWLATDPTASGDPDVLVLGDLNSYAMEDPIVVLAAAGYANLEQPGVHSYSFDGQWGTLDYALANAALLPQVVAAAPWSINADEPAVLDYNTNYKSAAQLTSLYNADPYRASDHDPVVVELALTASPCTSDWIGFEQRRIRADEGQAQVELVVRRKGLACGAISVRLISEDAGATAGQDYVGVDTVLSWAADDASPRAVAIMLLDDDLSERGREGVRLRLIDADRATAGPAPALLLIRDNDRQRRR